MIVAAGLVIAFVLIVLFSRRDMRNCRWRRTGAGAEGTAWRCAYCGAEARRPGPEAPRECLDPARG